MGNFGGIGNAEKSTAGQMAIPEDFDTMGNTDITQIFEDEG
jgi:hypothetical protein